MLDECYHTHKSAPYAKMVEKRKAGKWSQWSSPSGWLTASPETGDNPNLEIDKMIDIGQLTT